jgi:hypothetical protein
VTDGGALACDYREARSRFLAAAEGSGAEVDHFVHPERGPDGEELAIDVAWTGPDDADDVVVVVSGTHGVEGFVGSLCQSRRLEGSHDRFGVGSPAIVHVHAFNPHGFAWVRRVNEDNVDLTRNFVDFDDPPRNPDYDELAADLAPTSWTPDVQAATRETILAWIREHGIDRFAAAFSGGQYDHPDGLFYGGAEPSWSHRRMLDFATDRLGDADRVVLLDLHTGLGERGEVELITHEQPGPEAYDRSVRWWGDRVASTESGDSISARLCGEWMPGLQRALTPVEVTGTALEWGTVDSVQVGEALRADNWLHRHGDPRGPDAPAIKDGLRAAFAPDDQDWAARVWEAFGLYLDRTVEALAR